MQFKVTLLVIRLLEQDIGADACLLELAVVLNCGCGNIDIDAADRSVFVFDTVNCFDALKDILDRVVDRILTRLDRQSFVAEILQCNDLSADLILRKLFARNMLVFRMVRAVDTALTQ